MWMFVFKHPNKYRYSTEIVQEVTGEAGRGVVKRGEGEGKKGKKAW